LKPIQTKMLKDYDEKQLEFPPEIHKIALYCQSAQIASDK